MPQCYPQNGTISVMRGGENIIQRLNNQLQNHINVQFQNENPLVTETKNTSTVYHKSELLFAAKNIMRLSPGLLMRNACLTSPDLPTQDSFYSQIS